MTREKIDVYDLAVPAFGLWDKTWFVLTAGTLDSTAGGFNAMTVSWGGLGFLWGRPLAMVVVRPQRYTFEFMNRGGDFSLCAFGEPYRAALNLLGSQSGRDSAKMRQCGLTPIALTQIASPGYAEAELVLECRKTYWHDLEPGHFLADYIAPQYHQDYHRVYFAEVVAVAGTAAWRRRAGTQPGT